MLDRFKRAIEAGKAAAAAADDTWVAEDPKQTPVADRPVPRSSPLPEPEPLIAFLALDETGSATPDLVRRLKVRADAKGTRPLFIVGSASEADFFSDQSLLCEFLPSHEEIFRATEERADVIRMYRQHRLRLILDKWRVEECEWIGDTARELVDQLATDKDQSARRIRFSKA